MRYWVEGNVTIIVNDRDVVVFDASGAPRSARTVIAFIRRVTDKPVSTVVNSHGHGDHTIGNQEYAAAFPGVEIVAHSRTADYIAGRGYRYVEEIAADTGSRKRDGEAEIARLEAESRPENRPIIDNLVQYFRHDLDVRQAEYRSVRRTPPTAIVDESLRLRRGERTIEILHLGPGNTEGDLVAYLPRERIVCAGDLVTEPIPFGFSRVPLEWLETLERLAELDFDTLVPGHGAVQHDKAYLRRLIDLFRSEQGQVRDAMAAGLDLEEVRARVDLSPFEGELVGDDPVIRYFFQRYWVEPSIERTLDELRAREGSDGS